jgi:hypothetical protein
MYKWRHLVENFFAAIKDFRRIATRYDKTDSSFKAMVYLVSGVLAACRSWFGRGLIWEVVCACITASEVRAESGIHA